MAVPPSPWKLLSEDVRTYLSAAGELEVSLAEKTEQLRAEQNSTQALREDLEAAQEGLRPLQRALMDKEEKLTEETQRADGNQREHDVIKDAYDKLTAGMCVWVCVCGVVVVVCVGHFVCACAQTSKQRRTRSSF